MLKTRSASASLTLRALAAGLGLTLTLAAGAAQAEGPVLKFSTGGEPVANPIVPEMLQAWAAEVNKAAEGKLTLQVIPGPTLSNPRNFYERVANGVADLSWGIHGATGVPFPKTQVASLPFMVKSLPAASVALWRLYADGTISDEYKNVQILGLVALPPNGLHSKRKFNTVAELAGTKMRAADKISSDTALALGASPVSVPGAESYQALSSGVVDVLLGGWTVVDNFRLSEVVNRHLNTSLGSVPGMIVMNKNAYDRLPPDAKEVLDRFAGEALSRRFGEWFAQNAARAEARAKETAGQEVYAFSDEEQTKMKAMVAPVIEQWKARTPDAAKVLDAFQKYQDEAQ